jgi:GTP-binding protein HflX
MTKTFISTSKRIEKAVLVGIITNEQSEERVNEYLDELEFLADTAGVETKKRFTQKLDFPNAKTFVGTGKLGEIKEYISENEIDIVVFDDELSPSQLRNIEKMIGCRVLDRTNLILDIFAQRARSAHAKVQVELAQYEYLLPRLTRMWTHLERQRGGIGLRGPGETEIETDRRVIREKIARCKEQLKKIDRQMETQRQNRGKMVRVALVGYTNVGKSTIMNLISKSEVFAENKLFATLDTTVRKVVIGNLPFLLTDTVGFIRKLPTHLIESFKSTLDEVRESDVLVHIVDIAHPNHEEHISVVTQTLTDIGAGDKTVIMVFNKIDAYTYEPKESDDLTPVVRRNYTLEELKRMWLARINTSCVFISARQKFNIEEFKKSLYDVVKQIHQQRYPYDDFLYPVTFLDENP